jgi:diguanylate cyclase (GGDEF)-like protein/PAS domain S-box-containing protein
MRKQRVVLDTPREGVVLQSEEEGVLFANRAAGELLGLVEAPEVTLEQIGAFADLFEADGSPLDFEDTPAKRARRSGHAERGRLLQLKLPNGSHRWIQVNAVLMVHEDDVDGEAIEDFAAPPRPVRVLSTIIDLTERVDADQRADQDHQLPRATFDSVHAGLLAVNADGRIIQVNQQFRDLTRGHHQVGQTLLAVTNDYLICNEYGMPFEVHERLIVRGLAGETVSDLVSLLRWPDGVELVILASASPIYDGDDIVGAVLTIQNVTALRPAEAELRKLATIDQLTGLPNRRAVIAHLDAAIERHSMALNRTAELPNRRVDDVLERPPAASEQLTVLFLDLDGFKSINDTLGHKAGDELLCIVAQRLTAMMRSGDLVGRMGGDEFVAVLERISPGHTAELAACLEMEIARPILLAAGIATIGVSVGQAVHTASNTTDSMLAAADVEMYLTKRSRSDDQSA